MSMIARVFKKVTINVNTASFPMSAIYDQNKDTVRRFYNYDNLKYDIRN